MPENQTTARPLTPKGAATRARIVDTAAELFYEHGVRGTSNELIKQSAHISGSQLNHYFPDREALVRAVVGLRSRNAAAPERFLGADHAATIDDLRAWADRYAEQYGGNGCRLGSLAGELLKSDLQVTDDVAQGFAAWEQTFRRAFEAMRTSGELLPTADPAHLALSLLASLQGGMLLAQTTGSVDPLAAALRGGVELVERYAGR